MRLTVAALLGACFVPSVCAAQAPDPALMTYINAIRAVDDHAHVVAPDAAHDKGYDALPCDSLPGGDALPPANMRFGPDLQAAWMALYSLRADSDSPRNLQAWEAKQQAVRESHGAGYFEWVLAQAGIETVLANRVTMALPLDARHFRWVPYDDALLFPLNNSAQKAASPDRAVLFAAEEQLLAGYMSALAVRQAPASLDGYLEQVVGPTLEYQKNHGAVAIKFEVAYLRALDFHPAARGIAADVYARHVSGGAPGAADYKQLQDFLFRAIAEKAGSLGLAIQIHTGAGCGTFFDDPGSDPMLLASVLNDPALRQTHFVLLHGGSPFDRHITSLIVKPNVWVDTSVLELLFSSAELARILRPWLEMMPEHVMFGSDAGPSGPGLGWEETTWIASRKTRLALGIALTQMMRDGVVTAARAKAIADGVLRQHALELYHLK
jgi:uncharacterized protein